MNCPRCNSRSVLHSHSTVACLACGHLISEPTRLPWNPDDLASPESRAATALAVANAEERRLWGTPRLPGSDSRKA